MQVNLFFYIFYLEFGKTKIKLIIAPGLTGKCK